MGSRPACRSGRWEEVRSFCAVFGRSEKQKNLPKKHNQLTINKNNPHNPKTKKTRTGKQQNLSYVSTRTDKVKNGQ
jgi:hypothetical protein